jgi:hypothetical protein
LIQEITPLPETLPAQEALSHSGPGFGTLETVFEALGRVIVVLDRDFRVIRTSQTLDDLAFPGAALAARGRPIQEVVGRGFGPSDTLRRRSSRASGKRAGGRSSAAEKEAPASSR